MQNLISILPFHNREKIVVRSQTVGDIISGILYTHRLYARQYNTIANNFSRGSIRETAKSIFDYLKKNTIYKVESDNWQTLRSPAAILRLGAKKNVGLDCKSYSLFIAGILDALKRSGKKINWCYRFASYNIIDSIPHHVFVVINPNTKNEIWVDPVMRSFDEKKKYHYKIDKYMSLVQVSGIGRRKKTSAQKQMRKQKIKEKIKKAGRVVLKWNPATATARNAFLLLVKLNVFRLATRLNELVMKDERKLQSFWKQIGGNYSSLLKNINTGKNKRQPKNSEIGAAPVVAAGAVTTATPIILKIVKLLKEVGISTDDLTKIGKKIVQKVVENKIDRAADSGEDIFSTDGGEESSEDNYSSNDGEDIAEDSSDDSNEDSGENVGYPFIGGRL